MNRIAVLTSGGDCPGMNACLRAILRCANKKGIEVYGIEDGYKGLVEGIMYPLTPEDGADRLQKGGTFLGTVRLPEFVNDDVQYKAIEQLKKHEIEGLIVIGGDGSYRGAEALALKGVKVIAIPGTIDNDIGGTEETIGFHTAINNIVDAVEKLRDTSASHHRCFVVEVMGNHSDELALYSSIACGSEFLITKNTGYNEEETLSMVKYLEKYEKRRHAIIIASEKILDVEKLAKRIDSETGFNGRAIVLGHIQRGGSPVPEDRILASQMGKCALDGLLANETNKCVCKVKNDFILKGIDEALKEESRVKRSMYELSDELI